ncbi:hypothetical protein WQQ_08220 [Hydrocarboniphaga effusa AP103]|uniref:Uncharacterized protein n=1 Tax=Hydrocarboniphaga effusa AP103 TaxID=1172194 RepID=I8TAF2_9GAMM|nr:hypothetical protein WQQ_08220 [Hydrocarboniphaga effusa AP103]
MHPIRFDRGYSRRHFIGQMGRGVLATGVLAPLADVLAATGSIEKAYPDELLSIENYTKGKLKVGDFITADNVESVKELLTPIVYTQVAKMGRKLKLAATTTDIMRLSPWEYLEATFSNKGKARFDERGNVVTDQGKPWIGGNPFPDPKSAIELFAGLTLSWGRHDASFYTTREYDISERGELQYEYESGWAEMSPVARTVLDPKPYWPEQIDKLRFQCAFFTAPNSVRGTSFPQHLGLRSAHVPGALRLRAGVQARAPVSDRSTLRTAGAGLRVLPVRCLGRGRSALHLGRVPDRQPRADARRGVGRLERGASELAAHHAWRTQGPHVLGYHRRTRARSDRRRSQAGEVSACAGG